LRKLQLTRVHSRRAEWAAAQGLGVLVLNPNHPRAAGRSEGHTVAAWDACVTPAAAAHVVAVAHSYGGVCTVALLTARRGAVTDRLRAVAFTDSVHGRSAERMPAAQRDFLVKHCVNWVASDRPLDTLVRAAVHKPPAEGDEDEDEDEDEEDASDADSISSSSEEGDANEPAAAAAPPRCVRGVHRCSAPLLKAPRACGVRRKRKARSLWAPPWCDAARVSAGSPTHECTSEACRPSACDYLLRELQAAGWTPPAEAGAAGGA
jgi:hypothetical protein